jgi:hypothetical protein
VTNDCELDGPTLGARLNAALRAREKVGETPERLALDRAMNDYRKQVGPDKFLDYLCYRVMGIERRANCD